MAKLFLCDILYQGRRTGLFLFTYRDRNGLRNSPFCSSTAEMGDSGPPGVPTVASGITRSLSKDHERGKGRVLL